MWAILVEYPSWAQTLWAWLPVITTAARAAAAIIGLTVAVHRAVRYWRRRKT